jgi:hypothetical protein
VSIEEEEAYTYSFFIQYTEVYFARMKTKFFSSYSHHMKGLACLLYSALTSVTIQISSTRLKCSSEHEKNPEAA